MLHALIQAGLMRTRHRRVRGVGRFGTCVVCLRHRGLCRHHLVPRAAGGGRTVWICRGCHDFVHIEWGPGDDYDGPSGMRDFCCRARQAWLRVAQS